MKTRRARSADVPQIHELIEHYASRGSLLPRNEDDIRAHLGTFKRHPPKTVMGLKASDPRAG